MEPPPPPPHTSDQFAATRWTLVLAARGDSADAREALSALCDAYYAPVVTFLRREGRHDDEARELAHSFFAKVLAGGRIQSADRERGRFRSYLLGALKHHVQDERRAKRAARRGGNAEHIALHEATETSAACDPPAPADPEAERAFDRQWALTVLDRALTAIGADFERSGKRAWFEALRPWISGEASGRTQTELAESLGMSAGAVKVAIHRLRQKFRAEVKSEIARTVGHDEAEAKAELNHLLMVLS